MKADDGHFEYQRIVYFVVQIAMDFCVTLQNMTRLSFCKHSLNVRNDYVVTQEI